MCRLSVFFCGVAPSQEVPGSGPILPQQHWVSLLGRTAWSCQVRSQPQHHLPGASPLLNTTPGSHRISGISHLPKVSHIWRWLSQTVAFLEAKVFFSGMLSERLDSNAAHRLSAGCLQQDGQWAAFPQCHAGSLVLQDPQAYDSPPPQVNPTTLQ